MINLNEFNFSKYSLSPDGKIFSNRIGRFLTGWITDDGYHHVGITNDRGEHKQIRVHRLVALVYHGFPINDSYVPNHIDGNKLNNHYKNIEWSTPSGNSQHAHDTGLNRGKNYNESCVVDKNSYDTDPYDDGLSIAATEEDLRIVCESICQGYRDVDISRMTGINRRWINQVRHNETNNLYKSVIQEYNFSFKKEERCSPETVVEICKLLEKGSGVMEISRKFNVDRKTVGNIKNRKTFTRISSSYKW